MNRLRTLKRLNLTFAILLTIFNGVTSVSVGMRLGQHGWSYTERIIVEIHGDEPSPIQPYLINGNGYQIVEQQQTMAPMIAMLIFLWAFQALLILNVQFLKSLEKHEENHESEQESSQSQQNV